jgi:glutamate--cysteine ligase
MMLTLDAVHEYIHGVCFKTGPPGTVGAETEWLVTDPADPAAYIQIERLQALIGTRLPGGSLITYEPGGQLELSSAPQPGLTELHRALELDLASVRNRLGGLVLVGSGVDPIREPLLQARDERYRSMSAYFGAAGLPMMCSTASVQVCLDVGHDRPDAARRWRLAHMLGPILVAAFANSPRQAGRPTGWKSTRQAIWSRLDPSRTDAPSDRDGDPAQTWAAYALDAKVMSVRAPGGWITDPGMTFREWLAEGGPTLDDLIYHLSTLFPPVRPRGWYELRMIDAVPEPYWPVPIAVASALFDDPVATGLAEEAAEPVAGLWREAAVDGLADRRLARAARCCFAAARAALPRLGATGLVGVLDDYYERYVERGRCPADEEALEWTRTS